MIPLFLEVTQGSFDRLLVDFLQIIQTIGQDDCVLHRANSALSGAWKHLNDTIGRFNICVKRTKRDLKHWREARESSCSRLVLGTL